MAEKSKKQWKTLYRQQIKLKSCYCYLCGKSIKTENDFNLDHRTPLSRGGANDSSNWMPTHKNCNSEKGALTYEEWQLYQELLKKKYGHLR